MKIILPCAGMGTRLGLPYPKEIHLIAEQTALIDLTFMRLQNHASLISEVIIIITSGKAQIVDYLQKWKDTFYLKFLYFDDRNYEWAGSILSAEREFDEQNVVFLPDSFLVGRPDLPVLPTMKQHLGASPVCFGYLPCEDRSILRSLGALRVEGDAVTDFCDKPDDHDTRAFNAFWTTFGFSGDMGRPVLEMMTRSIQRNPVDIGSLAGGATAFPVQEYKDLGVWPNIVEFTHRIEETKTPFPDH